MLRLIVSLALTFAPIVVFGAAVPTPHFQVDRFQVEGTNPLSSSATEATLAPFKGQYDGIDGLLSAVDALNQALADKGYTFYKAVLPPQRIENGLVRLQIVEVTVGKVEVSGNRNFTIAISIDRLIRSSPSRL